MYTGKDYQLTVGFIRHGKTEANVKKLYLSHTDQVILPEEHDRIAALKAKGFFPEADMIFTSSLLRTKNTAESIYPGREYTAIADFDEMNFGKFELKGYNELKDDPDYRAWLDSGSTIKIPGGESLEEFIARQRRGFAKALIQGQDKNEIAIVCHGGTIMALVSSFTEADYYDCMMQHLEGLSCQVSYNIKGKNNVQISHFSLISRHCI